MTLNHLNELYREVILDHRRNPRNNAYLKDSTVCGRAINPFCGDEVHIQIQISQNSDITCVGLQSEGCSINVASGSMLTEAIIHKNTNQVKDITNNIRLMMQGDTKGEINLSQENGDILNLVAVRDYPIRIKCALLALRALDDALSKMYGI